MNDNDPLGPAGSELDGFLRSRDRTMGILLERLVSGVSACLIWSKPIALLAFATVCAALLTQHWSGITPERGSWLALGVTLLLLLTIDRVESVVGRWVYLKKSDWQFKAATC